jgi:hypothetical protein
MMKKYTFAKFLFLLFVILGNDLFSQTSIYKPFPTLYGKWVVQKEGPFDPSGGGSGQVTYSWTRYEANGDTIINSITYKKVSAANSIGYPTNPGGIPYGPSNFYFAYRNDVPNKKVYIYTNISGQYKDTLWYDFDLSIGDTLKSSFSLRLSLNDPLNQRTIVTSIDSVLICNVYYKRFQFGCGVGGFQDLGLIEGFGFEDNFIQTGYIYCPFEPVYIYHTDFSCSLTGVNEPTAFIKQLQIFPNPALNTLQINYPKQNITLPLNYSIMDCLGKVIITGTAETNKSIDVSKLKTGLYFIMIQDKEKNLFQDKFVKQ